MLAELVIENYAVIDRLKVRFAPGLTILTGETGSGKSIVVDALALLFGGRASAEMIRTGEDRARVSGIFSLPEGFSHELVDSGAGEILIEREVLAGGKSRAYLNSRPVAASVLKELAAWLGDIHGQHEQQLLFAEDSQLALLDQCAGLSTADTAKIYDQWRETSAELEEAQRNDREKLRLADLWTYQRQEIEAASPKAGEDEALEQERRVLMNLGRLQDTAGAAYSALYEAPESAVTLVRAAAKKLEEGGRVDRTLQELRQTLEPAEIALREAAYSLRDYLSRLEADPGRLEEIEARLAALEKLKRKYGATVAEVLNFLEEVKMNLASLERSSERIAELETLRDRLARDFERAASKLTSQRGKAARELEEKVVAELAGLSMEKTVFCVELEPAAWSRTGADGARFLVSPNPGEAAKSLEKVASGGELSRIALAIKSSITPLGAARTMVFDEVDAGVGGKAAERIGRRLKRLSLRDQVLCVTHLPQVAGFADHHLVVSKQVVKGRTLAAVEPVDGEARVEEIARMVSGEKLTPEARKHAEKLITEGAKL